MRRTIGVVLLAGSLAPLAPVSAAAQTREAVIGGAAGFAGGVVSTLSIVVARARFQGLYLDSAEDLIHWQTTPLIAGPAAGVVFGLAGQEVLKGSIVGSTTGMAAGAAIGAGLGWLLSEQTEWPWAGGVIGAGVGLNLGGLIGALSAWRDDDGGGDPAPPATVGLRIPL